MAGAIDITTKEFEEIRAMVRDAVGIQLNGNKRALVVSRLGKRLRHFGYDTFNQYCEHVRNRDPGGREMLEMINCITTNKTEFFREPHHFAWLREVLMREVRERAQASGVRKLRIWSAGCSTGQEPYSIAMVVADELGTTGWDVRVLASDIDTKVLAEAERGEYAEELLSDIPERLRGKYCERTESGFVVAKNVRDLVTFRRVNLIDRVWPIRVKFDCIFCRNVTIYFDQATQKGLYTQFVGHLEPHGYLVAGHSENLHWLAPLLTPIGGTVYRPAVEGAPRKSRRPNAKGASRRPPEKALSLAPPKGASRRPPGKGASRRPTAKGASLAPPKGASRRPGARGASRRPPQDAPSVAPPKGASRRPAAKGASLRPKVDDVAIQSGGMHVSAEPTVIRTVLGSCVAACIYDPVAAVGGMNHFMLPDGCATETVPMRFGSFAMEELLGRVIDGGGVRGRLRAKIFGGAHVLRDAIHSGAIPDSNVRFVREYLSRAGIPIESERVGGKLPMVIRFETHTGKVLLRTIETSEAEKVKTQEARYRQKLNGIARQSEQQIRAAPRIA